MSLEIEQQVLSRGVTRLCHFTPSRNLHHVLKSGQILDRTTLDQATERVVNPTDSHRFDGHSDKICCSVEYPNAYYLDVAAKKDPLFKDWVIIFLRPSMLRKSGAMFCRQNAAKANGRYIAGGASGYRELYSDEIAGRRRHKDHLAACPTDLQAEVLVPGPISFEEVIGIAMRSEEQIQTELVRWSVLGVPQPAVPIYVAPVLFDKLKLRDHIWAGKRPEEVRYA